MRARVLHLEYAGYDDAPYCSHRERVYVIASNYFPFVDYAHEQLSTEGSGMSKVLINLDVINENKAINHRE